MLQGDFFDISSLEKAGPDIKAELVINAGHKIFDGHFPGQPVVPGVCMMQMVKEIIEQVIEKKTNLVKADEMKFIAIINPQVNNIIQAALKYNIGENNNLSVSATLFKGERTHFKFKGLFSLQELDSH
jgi:3-hydroxyacyl-[acyl-carrier-protein] dehydratase